jgi:hypothetical protein
MSEKQAIQVDNNKFQGDFQSARVTVVFPEDLISAITSMYVEFIIKVAELYEQEPTELEIPGIPLLSSFLKSLGLPPDQRYKAFSKIADATGRINPDPSETIEDLFEAIY